MGTIHALENDFYIKVSRIKRLTRGQDIYNIQDETTTSPSSSESEKAKGEESSEEIDSQEERDLLMVRRLLGGQSCDLVNWIDAIKLHLYCCSIFFSSFPFLCVFAFLYSRIQTIQKKFPISIYKRMYIGMILNHISEFDLS